MLGAKLIFERNVMPTIISQKNLDRKLLLMNKKLKSVVTLI